MDTFRVVQGAEIWAKHGEWITTAKPHIGAAIAARLEIASRLAPDAVAAAKARPASVIARLDALIGKDDVLVLPTSPRIAPLKGTEQGALEITYRFQAMQLLCIAGLGGLPQISLPLREPRRLSRSAFRSSGGAAATACCSRCRTGSWRAPHDELRGTGYGARVVGFGEKPGIAVVDFQRAFTDPAFATGGAPLVRRAVENTARLLKVARAAGVPVAACYMAYHSERDAPYWKVAGIAELRDGDPGCELDPLIADSVLRLRAAQERAVDLLQHAGRGLFRQEPLRHHDRHRLHHVGLRARQHRRRLQPRLPHHRAGGLRRRPRAGGAPGRTCATSSAATPTSPPATT